MGKIFTALGLMSGTSGDGIDASIISSDGIDQYSEIINEYFKYDEKIYVNLHNLRKKIVKFDSGFVIKYEENTTGKTAIIPIKPLDCCASCSELKNVPIVA